MRSGEKVIIGVGGNIGSGKTMVSRIFEKLGAYYISADEIGWEVLPEISYRLKNKFGSDVMVESAINRKKLRNIVFSNKDALDYLNQLSHPLLIKKILEQIGEIESGMVVVDAALLFDWPEIYKMIDFPILVVADTKLKEKRAVKDGIDRDLFRKILGFQKSEAKMSTQAKFIIKNNDTLNALKKKCQNIYKEIKNDC
jgi:dephospho-CoA kinase